MKAVEEIKYTLYLWLIFRMEALAQRIGRENLRGSIRFRFYVWMIEALVRRGIDTGDFAVWEEETMVEVDTREPAIWEEDPTWEEFS